LEKRWGVAVFVLRHTLCPMDTFRERPSYLPWEILAVAWERMNGRVVKPDTLRKAFYRARRDELLRPLFTEVRYLGMKQHMWGALVVDNLRALFEAIERAKQKRPGWAAKATLGRLEESLQAVETHNPQFLLEIAQEWVSRRPSELDDLLALLPTEKELDRLRLLLSGRLPPDYSPPVPSKRKPARVPSSKASRPSRHRRQAK
jgi:hypothetical protein